MQLGRYVLTRRDASGRRAASARRPDRARFAALPVLFLLLLLFPATGCATRPVAGPPRAAAFNATDIAWIQLMIPMDERARLLTDLAPARAGDPALAGVAARAADGTAAELLALRGLLALSAAPDTRPHEGHDMPDPVRAALRGRARLGRLRGGTGARGRDGEVRSRAAGAARRGALRRSRGRVRIRVHES
ncbi:DUF305 domain-containing protein [Streptomyces sp. NPDC054961]